MSKLTSPMLLRLARAGALLLPLLLVSFPSLIGLSGFEDSAMASQQGIGNCTEAKTAVQAITLDCYNICIQDDNNPDVVLFWNTFTGAFLWCDGYNTFYGTGKVGHPFGAEVINYSDKYMTVTGKYKYLYLRGTGVLHYKFLFAETINDTFTLDDSCECTSLYKTRK